MAGQCCVAEGQHLGEVHFEHAGTRGPVQPVCAGVHPAGQQHHLSAARASTAQQRLVQKPGTYRHLADHQREEVQPSPRGHRCHCDPDAAAAARMCSVISPAIPVRATDDAGIGKVTVANSMRDGTDSVGGCRWRLVKGEAHGVDGSRWICGAGVACRG